MNHEQRRKLEAEIARLIFGSRVRTDVFACGQGAQYQPFIENERLGRLQDVPRYTELLEDAWAIVEQLRRRFWIAVYDERHADAWRVSFAGIGSQAPNFDAIEATVPLAICHAALMAIGQGALWPT